MDYFAKWGWKVVLDRFLWKGKFLFSSQSCMHCSGCYSGPELYNLCILFMIIMIFIVMNNGNGPPARIEFPGSPDGKLKSHLQWPYWVIYSRNTLKSTSIVPIMIAQHVSKQRWRPRFGSVLPSVLLILRTGLLSLWLGICAHWASHVDGAGFKQLVNYLEPGYKVPSHSHVTSICRKKFNAMKEQLLATLATVQYVAVTTEI